MTKQELNNLTEEQLRERATLLEGIVDGYPPHVVTDLHHELGDIGDLLAGFAHDRSLMHD